MAQVVWLDAGTTGRLLVVVHHLAVDGVSWRILLPDLTAAYEAIAAGREPALPPVPTSFRHWASEVAAQAATPERLAELPYWAGLHASQDPLLTARPVDPVRDTEATLRDLSVHIPAAVTAELLTSVPAAFHAGVDDVLLTGLAAAVAEWRRGQGQSTASVLVDIEGHGRIALREGDDLSRTVGWFTRSHPVRLDTGAGDPAAIRSGGPAAGSALKRIKEQLRAVPGDGLGHGMLRHLNPRLGTRPAAQIGFNYLGRFPAPAAGGQDWSPAPEDGRAGTDGGIPVHHALEAMGVVHDLPEGPRLTLTLAWPGRLLAEPSAQALLDSWAAMLTGLATHTSEAESGGHTPSDFPLIALDQHQIDQLENELAQDRGAR
jgi:non-ribosomal peptide synthase protein (TIGR01720 family)